MWGYIITLEIDTTLRISTCLEIISNEFPVHCESANTNTIIMAKGKRSFLTYNKYNYLEEVYGIALKIPSLNVTKL